MENTEITANKQTIFEKLYTSLNAGIKKYNATAPHEWLSKRKFTTEITEAGFNSGQIHRRKEQQFKDELESIGFIKKTDIRSNTGELTYRTFGKFSITFPLRNENNEVVNFYAISIEHGKTQYLNQDGIYPKYPDITTKKLYIAPTIPETATILQAKILNKNEAVISLFDSELKQQHIDAISKLEQLQEIIFITKK